MGRPDTAAPVMMHYPFYTPDADGIEDLLRSVPAGRLITTGADGGIGVGLYPFVGTASRLEIHLNKADPQLAALRERPGCIFQVDELLARIPSHWVHPETATYADLYYRSATFHGEAHIQEEPGELGGHLDTLLGRHQESGSHLPVDDNRSHYASAMSRIRLVRIAVAGVVAKFKLGQQESPEVQRRIVDALRARGGELDLHTASQAERAMG